MIRNISKEVLSDYIFSYHIYHFEFLRQNGKWQDHKRIVLNKGDGAAVLMLDRNKKIALFVKQFRYPTFENEKIKSFIEVCAGVLDQDDPITCIKREAIEETGYEIKNIVKKFDSYMSPGVVTERLHLFIADYDSDDKIATGGGLEHETEDIELIEIPFSELSKSIETGFIRDAKTILLIQSFLLSSI